MKKLRILIIFIPLILTTGCFQMKTISFTDKTNIDSNMKDSSLNDQQTKNEDIGLMFYTGKVELTSKGEKGSGNQSSTGDKTTDEPIFSNLEEFYNYIIGIKEESDIATEIIEIPGYTKVDIEKAIYKNNELKSKMKKIQLPEELLKTEEGEIFAEKFANNNLESILTCRNNMLEKKLKALSKMTSKLEWDINKYERTVIPSKVAAFNFTGRSMMEAEGYVWNTEMSKFEKKK